MSPQNGSIAIQEKSCMKEETDVQLRRDKWRLESLASIEQTYMSRLTLWTPKSHPMRGEIGLLKGQRDGKPQQPTFVQGMRMGPLGGWWVSQGSEPTETP